MSRNKKKIWEKHRFFRQLNLGQVILGAKIRGKNKAQDHQPTLVKLIICVSTDRIEKNCLLWISVSVKSLPWFSVTGATSQCGQVRFQGYYYSAAHVLSTAGPLKWSAPEDWAESRNKLSRGLHLKLIFQGRIMAVFPFLFKSPQTEMRGVSLFQKTGRSKSKLMHNRTKKMPLQRLASMLRRGFNHGTENPLALCEYLSHRSCSLMLARCLYLSLCNRPLFLSLIF